MACTPRKPRAAGDEKRRPIHPSLGAVMAEYCGVFMGSCVTAQEELSIIHPSLLTTP